MPRINTPNDPEFELSQWSEWAWDDTRGSWKRYRYNFTNSEYEFQNGGSGDSSSVPRTVPAAQNVEQMPNSSQRLKQQSYSFSMQSDDEMPIASEYSPREDWTTRSTHSRNNISNLAEFPTSYTEPVNYTTNGSAKSSFEPDYINVYGSMPQRSESAPLTSNEKKNHMNIQMFDRQNLERIKIALLDTGATAKNGLYVSYSLVVELDRVHQIDRSGPQQSGAAVDGHIVMSRGTISLDWRVLNGSRIHRHRFQVLERSTYDVILGYDFMESNGMLKIDLGSISPFGPAQNESPEARQDRYQAQLEQDRLAQEAKEKKEKRDRERKSKGGRSRH